MQMFHSFRVGIKIIAQKFCQTVIWFDSINLKSLSEISYCFRSLDYFSINLFGLIVIQVEEDIFSDLCALIHKVDSALISFDYLVKVFDNLFMRVWNL